MAGRVICGGKSYNGDSSLLFSPTMPSASCGSFPARRTATACTRPSVRATSSALCQIRRDNDRVACGSRKYERGRRGPTDAADGRSLADFSMQSFARSDFSRALRHHRRQTDKTGMPRQSSLLSTLIDLRWKSATQWYDQVDQASFDRQIPHLLPGIAWTAASEPICVPVQRSAKRRGCLLSYSQAEPGRELTQPSPRLLAEPCT